MMPEDVSFHQCYCLYRYYSRLARINAMEPRMMALSEAQLKAMTGRMCISYVTAEMSGDSTSILHLLLCTYLIVVLTTHLHISFNLYIRRVSEPDGIGC